MTEETFTYILENIKLPVGKLLSDKRTYRVTRRDFPKLDERSQKALGNFDKFLVLSDGKKHVVGGILFYGRIDLQAWVFPQYRGQGYMSAIHKNGILRAELEEKQRVTISEDGIDSPKDFEMKCHLLSLIGLKANNEDAIREEYLPLFKNESISANQDNCDSDPFRSFYQEEEHGQKQCQTV